MIRDEFHSSELFGPGLGHHYDMRPPLFREDSDYDNLGYQYFGGGRQNYAGLESGGGGVALDDPGHSYLLEPRAFATSAASTDVSNVEVPGNYRGLGPKNYRRSDARIEEELCERLTRDRHLDVSEVSVTVRDGVVMLEGEVEGRSQKYYLEDIAAHCRGVRDVQNRVMVSQRPQ